MIVIGMVGCVIAGVVARSRGRSMWWLLLGWIGFLIVMGLPNLSHHHEETEREFPNTTEADHPGPSDWNRDGKITMDAPGGFVGEKEPRKVSRGLYVVILIVLLLSMIKSQC